MRDVGTDVLREVLKVAALRRRHLPSRDQAQLYPVEPLAIGFQTD
jgi:hypothetical protein